MVNVYLSVYLLLHLCLLSVELRYLFIHSSSIPSLFILLLSVLRSHSTHLPINSLSICRLMD